MSLRQFFGSRFGKLYDAPLPKHSLHITLLGGETVVLTREHTDAGIHPHHMWVDVLTWYTDDNGSATHTLHHNDGLTIIPRSAIIRIIAYYK